MSLQKNHEEVGILSDDNLSTIEDYDNYDYLCSIPENIYEEGDELPSNEAISESETEFGIPDKNQTDDTNNDMVCHGILKNKHDVCDDISSSTASTTESTEFSRSLSGSSSCLSQNEEKLKNHVHVKFSLDDEDIPNPKEIVENIRSNILKDIDEDVRNSIMEDLNQLPDDPEISTFEAVIFEYEKETQRLVNLNASLMERVAGLMVEKNVTASEEAHLTLAAELCKRGDRGTMFQEDEDIYIDMIMKEEKLQKTIKKLKKKLRVENRLVCQLGLNLKQAADKIEEVSKERDEWKDKYKCLEDWIILEIKK